MARIKIKDLSKGQKISREEMKKVMGGTNIDLLLQNNLDLINLNLRSQSIQNQSQMMSNISRMYRDMSKSIINNLRS